MNLPVSGSTSDILHGDGTWGPGGTGGGNVSSCSGVLTNYIPVFDASSNICTSDLYNTTGKRVGMNTITPNSSFHTIADGFDASFITANSSGDYAIFANFDNRVSIGSNTTWNTGGGQGARLWVKGFTAAGSGSPLIGLLATDANSRPYFETDDDGKVLIGRYFANNGYGPEGRMAINAGGVNNFVNLYVKSSYNSVSGNNERAFAARNSSYSDLLTCWADEHVTMGYGYIANNDARLNVAALPNTLGRAAYFGGDIYFNGAWQLSDSTLKRNIQPVSNAINLVKLLDAKFYDFDTTMAPGMTLPNGQHFGFLAQAVQRILPNLVSEHTSPAKYDSVGNIISPSRDFLAMNYTEIIPILASAIKEQQATIDSMNDRMTVLEARMSICCPSPNQRLSSTSENSNDHSVNIELSSSNSIILNQNDPNPFSEKTRITFNIPETVGKAEIIFYTDKGVVLKSVVLNTRGTGEMNVFASDLSSGIYMYSLVADGKTIDSKKMICVK